MGGQSTRKQRKEGEEARNKTKKNYEGGKKLLPFFFSF